MADSVRPASPSSQPDGTMGLEQKRNLSGLGFGPARRLLPRQELFAGYCLVESSAARAAIRAGYSPRSAYNQAHRLLANDEIRRRIEGGLAAMRARDEERRDRHLALLERAFAVAMDKGRLEPALGALKAQAEVSGIVLRHLRLSPAQRAHMPVPVASDDGGSIRDAVGPDAPGKL